MCVTKLWLVKKKNQIRYVLSGVCLIVIEATVGLWRMYSHYIECSSSSFIGADAQALASSVTTWHDLPDGRRSV